MLYATSHGSYTVRFHLRLDQKIDGQKLRSALDKTARRYPYFCVCLRRNEREFYYEVNDQPVALLHTDKAITLGSPETGRHIREFWTETPVGPFPLIEVAAVNGKIFVSFLQPFSDRRYYDALLDELKENGIEYVECGTTPVCVADIRACE